MVRADIAAAWAKRKAFQRAEVFAGIAGESRGVLRPSEERATRQLNA